MTRCGVGLVLVSHSTTLAAGIAEVAREMAPDVPIREAGGRLDGGIGTSFEKVDTAVRSLLAQEGIDAVVMLTDLGSAVLTAGAVLDGLEDPRVSVVDAPVVEGAVAAAVASQTGGDCVEVRRAVSRVSASFAEAAAQELAQGRGDGDAASGERTRTLHLVNRLGLHARPAALLARAASGFDAVLRVNGVPATSVLELMSLGLGVGAEITLVASGPEADAALAAVERLVLDRFSEDGEER